VAAGVCTAIRDMWVRGAPLIGATAAYGLALQMPWRTPATRRCAAAALAARRRGPPPSTWPGRCSACCRRCGRCRGGARRAAWDEAGAIAEEDVAVNAAIGRHGLALLQAIAARNPGPVNVLTHCNAGWLATVDWGTATAPIYQAHAAGLPLHVWVDETRPRNQGASLTAWELGQSRRAAHRGGRQRRRPPDAARPGRLVIVGCDRVTRAATSATRSAPT
jgi:methylthioribose-1-phosphate isomerase